MAACQDSGRVVTLPRSERESASDRAHVERGCGVPSRSELDPLATDTMIGRLEFAEQDRSKSASLTQITA